MKKKIMALLLSMCTVLALPSTKVNAANRTLNVQAYMTTSELGIYSVPYAFNGRLPLAESGVYAFYKAIASIDVNINFESINGGVTSYQIDACKGADYASYDTVCNCSTTCSNSGPYHCTNVYSLRREWNSKVELEEDNRVNMLITAIRLCKVENSQHKTIRGLFFPTDNKLMVRDVDFVKEGGFDIYRDYEVTYFRAAMIHEIGHLYGILDHEDRTGNSSIDDCIWGANKDDTDVVNGLFVCANCYETLRENANRYAHS